MRRPPDRPGQGAAVPGARERVVVAGAALALALSGIACTGGEGGLPPCGPARARREAPPSGGAPGASPSLWRLPPETVNLTGCPAEIDGPSPRRHGPLGHWGAAELAAWKRAVVASRVRITGPPIPEEAAEASRLVLVLTPGGATEVQVAPFVVARQSEVDQRKNRTIIVGLERDAPPDEPVAISVDLTEAVRGNWGDAVTESRRLDHLEITLPGADAGRVVLREVVLEGPMRGYEEAVAGVRQVEVSGLVRPAWYLNPGGSVRIRARVPLESPELRWHDAGLPGAPGRAIRLLEDGEPVDLWRSTTGAGEWRLERIDLTRWAGREITLELSAERSVGEGGAGFFGDPRILAAAPVEPAGVLVYLIDALRADSIGARGASGPSLTPALDRLAGSGVRFARAISTSAWTKPAIPTLMTGIPPTTHLVGASSYSDRLPESVETIQGLFRDAGWRTGSFSASPLGSTLSGLDRGFALAAPPRRWAGRVDALLHPGAEQIHAELLDWIAEEPDRPFFAYVHTLEVHSYTSSAHREESEPLAESYLRAVGRADGLLDGLLEALRAAGRDRGLLVAVVADHGESLGARVKEGHGTSLHQVVIQIPMLLSGAALDGVLAGRGGAVVEDPVSLADLAPTLADLAGLPRLEEAAGRSLAPLIAGAGEGAGAGRARFVTASILRYVHWPGAPKQHALITSDLRKIHRVEGEPDRFFDLRSDPWEESPLPSRDEALARMLDAWIEDQGRAAAAFRSRHGAAVRSALDAGEAERLRSLGYLE